MARLARAEIFDPAEIVAVHLIGKTVRSCYLMGVRSRPDVVATWDDTQVALRWWQLCPTRKVKLEINGEWVNTPATPTEFELNAIRNDPVRLATVRLRLSDLSWRMRLDFAFLSTWRTPQNAASRMEITQSIFAMFFGTSRSSPPTGSKALPWNPLNCRLCLGCATNSRSQELCLCAFCSALA